MSGKFGVALVGRNDNYGGQFAESLKYVLNSCLLTYDEVNFVDWNTPLDRPLLLDLIRPELFETGKLRYIIVRPELHHKLTDHFPYAEECSEVLGRNVGVRRLNTEYKICTNADEIQPPREYLEQHADPKIFTTVARHGVQMSDVKALGGPKDIESIRTQFAREGHNQAFPIRMSEDDCWSVVAWCGDLQMAHSDVWEEIQGYDETALGSSYADTYIQRKAMEMGYQVVAAYDVPIFHIDHHKSSELNSAKAANPTDVLYNWYPKYTKPEVSTWGLPQYNLEEIII